MTRPCPAPLPPQAPNRPLPPGACDCHTHVLGPFERFPLAPERAYTPPPAPVDDLKHRLQVLGLERVVVAHVSAHGHDLAATLHALDALGEQARGVAILAADTTDAELNSLHERGIRGVRLSSAYGTDTPINLINVQRWAERVGPRGWHIAMWPGSAEELSLLRSLAPGLHAPLVIDHLANHAWQPEAGLEQPGFGELLRLLDTGRVWLKVSGMARASTLGYPWPDLQPYVQRLLTEYPERVIWASDWPHVGLWDSPMPACHELINWLDDFNLSEQQRQALWVSNPEKLYGFEAMPRT